MRDRLGSVLIVVYMGRSTSSSIWFLYSHWFRLLHENSGWEYFCSEEMRGGFLRPSLEQTLVFTHMRLVGKQEGAVVVGTCLIHQQKRIFGLYGLSGLSSL